MSEKALITRAKRITNIPKLLSFITVSWVGARPPAGFRAGFSIRSVKGV